MIKERWPYWAISIFGTLTFIHGITHHEWIWIAGTVIVIADLVLGLREDNRHLKEQHRG